MATHDYNLANQDGASFRSDLNNALAAIVSNNSSSTAPATTFAHQIWVDTTANVIKQRNAANDAWVELWRIDGGFNAKTFSSNVTLNAQSDLRFADSDSSNWVAFQAPATVSSNVTWTLPASDGTSGQVIETNGSGVLSWADAGGVQDNITEGNTSAEVVDTGSDGHFKVVTEGTEAVRVDSSQRLLVGTTTSTPGAAGDLFEVAGNAPSAIITSTASSRSVDQVCGQLRFYGKAGANEELASIKTLADGTHGSGDKPSRLVFSTTADGASSPTERLRIAQSGAFGLSGANYGTSGQVLTSQGSGSAPQWATPSSSWTDYGSTNFTSSAISISGLNTGHTQFRCVISGQKTSGSAAPQLRARLGNGSTSAAGYYAVIKYGSSTTSNLNAGMLNILGPNAGSTNSYTGIIELASSGTYMVATWQIMDETNGDYTAGIGKWTVSNAIDRIVFYPGSGNTFTDGHVSVYSMA